MGLFRKKAAPVEPDLSYPSELFEPVLRSSICTGEKTAGFIDSRTGKYRDVMLITSDADIAVFEGNPMVSDSVCRRVFINGEELK